MSNEYRNTAGYSGTSIKYTRNRYGLLLAHVSACVTSFTFALPEAAAENKPKNGKIDLANKRRTKSYEAQWKSERRLK